jgi:Secretion system C-terminal sorting domain
MSQSNFLFQKVSDSDGTLLSSWDYGDSGVKNFLHKGIVLPGGGLLASGTRPSQYYDSLTLMKLDSSGNMLWYKKYRDISWTTDVIVNRKGNYLLSATCGDQIVSPILHPYFIEVSPDGDSINSKYLIVQADTVNEQKNNWTWGMLQNEDGDYVFTISIDSVDKKGGTLLDRYAAVVMMDTLFNIKWRLYLNKGTGGAFYPSRVIELKDSSYVLIVMNTNPYSNTFYYYKISKTGQILDQQTFTSSVCNAVHATEIKVLNDGSLLVSGACKDYENAYIARIDSVGLPMVSTVTSVAKQTQSLEVQVYPNPFTQDVTFNLPDGTAYKLTLLNALGEEIASYSFSGNEYTLNASALHKGLYMYVVRDEKGKTKSGKLIAE